MFCSKCGTMLPDGTNFCTSCGTPVAAPNPVYNTPVVEPAPSIEQVYQSPVIEPVNASASETGSQFTSVPEAPVVEAQFSAPVGNAPSVEAQFSAPVSDAPSMESQFSAPTGEIPAMSYNNQTGYNTGYSQQPNAQYTNPAFGNGNGNAAPNPQPVYPNSTDVNPDYSQNWGPLMPPKKKSKAPVIIALSVIALLIVAAVIVCCLIFCEKKGGAGSAEDALIAAFDAFADDDKDDALKAMHPLYNAMCEALEGLGSTYESLGLSSETLANQLIASSNPKSGGFKYSNLKIVNKETMDKEDVDEYNDTLRSTFKTYSVYFNAMGIDVGDIEDYMCEAAVTYSGTVNIDNTEYSFRAAMVKVDGAWYVATISSYEN